MTCKDCLHYERCKKLGIFNVETFSVCEDFADRSEWVHLPRKVGDRIYLTDGIRIYKSSIRAIKISSANTVYFTENISFDERAIGGSIFFTREEAEKAAEKKI